MRTVIDRVATRVVLPDGAVLFRKGEDADSFYILDDGEIEISVTSVDGKKLSLEVLTTAEIFGEIGLFAGRRTADATALSPAKLRRVRRTDVLAAIRTEPDLALQMIDLLCARLRSVSEKLEERAFLPLPARLARRFLHLSEKYADRGGTIPMSRPTLPISPVPRARRWQRRLAYGARAAGLRCRAVPSASSIGPRLKFSRRATRTDQRDCRSCSSCQTSMRVTPRSARMWSSASSSLL